MKKYILVFIGIITNIVINYSLIYAWWDDSAETVLDSLKNTDVQKTALDNAVGSNTKWFTDTLYAVKQSAWESYLQWLAYIGLWIALILIMYNGIMLLISGITGSDEIWKFRKRFVNLILWVTILTSGYLIIKFIVSIIGNLF